jgi:hypothetical protein
MENLLFVINPLLGATAERWMGLAVAYPVEALASAPAVGEWSALECLQHIIDTEKVLQFRVRAFLEGRDFPGFNPDEEGTLLRASAPVEMARQFAQMRRESLDLLADLKEADLERRARHAELGMVTLGEMLHEWVAHDLNHTVQAERALMQPFIRECGPWKIYFRDHVIEGR